MNRKNLLRKLLTLAIGGMMMFSTVACSNGGEASSDALIISESSEISMTEFSAPVSLLPWSVEEYLSADPEQLVTRYLVGGDIRTDKGAPVTVEYSFGRLDGRKILEEKF